MVHSPGELRHVEKARRPVPGRIDAFCGHPAQVLLAIRHGVRGWRVERDRSIAVEQHGGGNGRIRWQVVGQAPDEISLAQRLEQRMIPLALEGDPPAIVSTAVQNPATRRGKIRPGGGDRHHGARAHHSAGACHGALAPWGQNEAM